MVERTKAEMTESFDGMCTKIEIVPDQMNEGMNKIHLELAQDDEELLADTKTQRFHVWLRMTDKTTDKSVPEGSKIEAYLKEIEIVIKEAKKAVKVLDAFKTLEGKHVRYVRKVLGRSYKGYEARPDFVPQALLN